MSRFSRGLRREWKIPVLGCLAFTIAKFISHSDVPSLKWIGIILTYVRASFSLGYFTVLKTTGSGSLKEQCQLAALVQL